MRLNHLVRRSRLISLLGAVCASTLLAVLLVSLAEPALARDSTFTRKNG